jgi:hypothetical protein
MAKYTKLNPKYDTLRTVTAVALGAVLVLEFSYMAIVFINFILSQFGLEDLI